MNTLLKKYTLATLLAISVVFIVFNVEKEPVVVEEPILGGGNEIIGERTVRSKTFDKGNGQMVTEFYTKPIHYVDDADTLQDVDLSFTDQGTYWEMLENNYTLRVAKDFTAPWLIQYKNQIKNWQTGTRANHTIKYEPVMLAWVNNPDLSDMQVFRNQQAVQGVLAGNVIRYTNAFGDGIHFEVTMMRTGFRKELVIDAKNKLELPPTANHKLVALFKYDGLNQNNAGVLRVRDNLDQTEWDSDTYKESENGFEIGEDDDHASLIRPAYIVDEGAEENRKQSIKVFWKAHNGFLWQAKVLPKTFLQDAVYPVRADTVTTVYPDAHTETDTVDGGGQMGLWSSTHAIARAETASDYDDDTNYLSGGAQAYSPASRKHVTLGYIFYRSYLSFKYNLPSGNTIDSVTLAIYQSHDAIAADDDAQAYTNVYEQTVNTGAKTSLSGTDTEIGSVDAATPLADNQALAGVSQFDTVTYTFNTTGEALFTADGTDNYIHFVMLEGHDAEDVAMTVNGDNTHRGSSAESGNAPALAITHSPAAVETATSTTPILIRSGSIRIDGSTLRNTQL